MRPNPQLQHLNAHDLNQRYNHSYTWYDGKIQLITGFSEDRPIPTIYIDNGREQRGEPFDWKKLDVTRATSRWYKRDEKGCFFLNYFPQRQYQRGYHDNNTGIVGHNQKNLGLNAPDLTTAHKGAPVERVQITNKQIDDSLDKYSHRLLTPMLLVTDQYVMFRKTSIGSYHKGQFLLTKPQFEQEIKEAVINPIIKDVEASGYRNGQSREIRTPRVREIPRPVGARMQSILDEGVGNPIRVNNQFVVGGDAAPQDWPEIDVGVGLDDPAPEARWEDMGIRARNLVADAVTNFVRNESPPRFPDRMEKSYMETLKFGGEIGTRRYVEHYLGTQVYIHIDPAFGRCWMLRFIP